jgi:hemerythrin-like domain-containing protein
MPMIHRIFRRQFAEVRALVQEVPAADATRVGAVADHLGFLLDGLHMHHTTEDDLIWPKLLDRVGLDAPLVERMEEQHQQVDASVAEVRAAMSAWRSDPTPVTSSALADRVGELLVVLEGHLDEEEQVVVPLIDRHLTEAEWQEVGQRGFEKFTPAQRWIATGQMVEVATPEEAVMMFGKLPPPVKVLWHLIGKRKYRRYITRVCFSSTQPDVQALYNYATAASLFSQINGGLAALAFAAKDRHSLKDGRRRHTRVADTRRSLSFAFAGGDGMSKGRAAAILTWVYTAAFGVPAIPVSVYLIQRGRLPTFGDLFEMYGGPWSLRVSNGTLVALMLGFLGVTLVAGWSAWLIWRGRRTGAVVNLALLPVEALFWVGFALPVPWVIGFARVALLLLGWRSLTPPRERRGPTS